jgi:2-hydroxy-3-keto-5-methylthiopentenyl-1-phosphate phosphatase
MRDERVTERKYKGVVSSDWSECLSPNGPFDPIAFNYPELESDLKRIFRAYTGNVISLREATGKIKGLLPKDFTPDQMDAYLDKSFQTYNGVPELIEWLLSRDILFMINTTGTQGYFQRVFAKRLLPEAPIVSANPMIRFDAPGRATRYEYQVIEIDDKPKNTAAVINAMEAPANRVVVMGDSGGDGPHFQWAFNQRAFLIGSMTKNSLAEYCRSRGIRIDRSFGVSYGPGEARKLEKEMTFNFMDLAEVIWEALGS